jgi:hypothetical protein
MRVKMLATIEGSPATGAVRRAAGEQFIMPDDEAQALIDDGVAAFVAHDPAPPPPPPAPAAAPEAASTPTEE